ncbi:myelin protein zero-like protein 1 [Paroedura picta]|uniref:myelin protein zero-like protein 1 n=1 Tax=Paroedura picta TaxID=143630 RepID=UPI004055E0D6
MEEIALCSERGAQMRAWSEGGRLVLHLGREAGGGKRGRSQNQCRMAQPQVLLASVLALAVLDLGQVSAVQVYTPREITVRNGTEARLQCTFRSQEVISSAASVTWSFQAQESPSTESFFYYSYGKAYPGKEIPFKDRIHWAGDLNKKDASISIANIQFRDNGTYICDVKNPPDIVVIPGEIRLRVVERDSADHDYLTQNTLCLAVGVWFFSSS